MSATLSLIFSRAPGPPNETRTLMAHFGAPGRHETAALHEALLRSEEFRIRRVRTYQCVEFEPLELDRPRLVFLYVERCRWATLRAMLEPLFEPLRVCPERFDGLGNWTVNELAAYDLFAGHFDLAILRSVFGTVRVFTMLREPKARLLSLYRFWRSHAPPPERDQDELMALSTRKRSLQTRASPIIRAYGTRPRGSSSAPKASAVWARATGSSPTRPARWTTRGRNCAAWPRSGWLGCSRSRARC